MGLSSLMFLPMRPRRVRSDLVSLLLGHGLETALATDLTALATDCGHVCGEIGGRVTISGVADCSSGAGICPVETSTVHLAS